MGEPSPPPAALLLLAAFSRHQAALDWARQRVQQVYGPVLQESEAFDFDDTQYYEPTMGSGLRKIFFALARFFDPGRLVDVKLQTNGWENEYARLGHHAEPRPLNLDPGYITMGKLVLASTKDFAHRIYLTRGIYGETTLYYKQGRWRHHQFTFPDYRREDYQRFFSQCREWLRRQPRRERGS
jgi:hypothetical protein